MVLGPNAFAARTLTVSALNNRTLRQGAKLRIWITKSGYIGSYIEYRVSHGKARKTSRCLPAGSLKPKTTCS
jgi:hypothetical protein